jgi:hypothetical protein
VATGEHDVGFNTHVADDARAHQGLTPGSCRGCAIRCWSRRPRPPTC